MSVSAGGAAKAIGVLLIGAFAMIGAMGEAERYYDRTFVEFSDIVDYQSIEPTRDVFYADIGVWFQPSAIYPTRVALGYFDELNCRLDEPDSDGATTFESLTASPIKSRGPAVIGRPAGAEAIPGSVPRRSAKFKWRGGLPPGDATCRIIATPQLRRSSGVILDTTVRSRTFRVEHREVEG